MAQQKKIQTFEFEFKSNGLKQTITDSNLLRDSIIKIPEIAKNASSRIEEMNELFKDGNNFMKAFGRQALFVENNVSQLGDTVSTVNKMQSIASSIFAKNNKNIQELDDSTKKFDKRFLKILEYLPLGLSNLTDVTDGFDNLTNGYDNLMTKQKKYTSTVDGTLFSSRKLLVAYDEMSNKLNFLKTEHLELNKTVINLDDALDKLEFDRDNQIEKAENHVNDLRNALDKLKKENKTLSNIATELFFENNTYDQELLLQEELKVAEQNLLDVRIKSYAIWNEKKSVIEKKFYEDQVVLNRLKTILSKEGMDKELEILNQSYESQAILAKERGEDISGLKEEYLKIESEIRDKYAKKEIAVRKKENNTVRKEKTENKEEIIKLTEEQEEQIKNIFQQSNTDIVEIEKQQQKDLDQLSKEIADKKLQDQQKTNDLLIQNTESFNDRQNELLDEAQQSMSNFVQANQEAGDAIVETAADTQESHKEHWSKISATMQEHVDIIMTGVNAIFSASNALLSEQLEEANEKFEAISEKYSEAVELRQESSDKISSLEEQAKNTRGGRLLILQEQINQEMAKNQQLAQQEKQLAKEKEKAEKEKEKKEKQIKKNEISQGIIQGVANTALGVTKAWSLGPIIGPIMAAIVGAAGAIQVGVMTKQLSKLEDGGFLKGKRHSQGGMRIEGTNIEVEGGEYVINRESTSKNLGLVRYINSQRKELNATDMTGFFAKASQGFELPFQREFAAGGLMPAIETPSTIDNEALIDAIKSIKINSRVAVTDIIRAQEDAVQVDRWSGN